MPVFKKKAKPLKPARFLVVSFAAAIVIGTFLLALPVSSSMDRWTELPDAFFTSVSATCVNGIVLYDTYSYWSLFGQAVIMLLIQIGGLGLATLVTFFNMAVGRKMGLVKQSTVAGDMGMTGLSGASALFFRIILFSFVFEIAGAIVFMFTFVPRMGGYGVFVSLFMSVSAFCNAGFDLMGVLEPDSGLALFTDSPQVLIPTMLLVFIGGIGFMVWDNIAELLIKKKKLTVQTKIVLITSGILLLLGTVMYLMVELLEPDKFGDMNAGEKTLSALFASVSARTSGFTAAPLPLANEFSRLGTMALMFIGAGPGSTSGGVKVTTVGILIMTIVSVIRGREDTQIFGHLVPKKAVYKALVVFSLSLAFITAAFICLYLLNPELPAMDILYEVFAIFSTTGFSCGVSGAVGTVSRLIICLTMFVGRVGPVSLFLSLTQDKKDDRTKIMPTSDIMIG